MGHRRRHLERALHRRHQPYDHQRRRGGGAVCFEHAGMANALYNSIDTSFMCKSGAEAVEATQIEAQVAMA